jgi:hypothetical protein
VRRRASRARGYALSELLVAVAITGLVVGLLTFLNVDYVGMTRRVASIQGPYAIGGRVQAGANLDRCATPGATLVAVDNQVEAQADNEATPVLALGPSPTGTDIDAAGGGGLTDQPVRVSVESAPAPGGSMASLEIGAATVGVIALRCDVPEVCDYDAANATCAKPMTNAINGTDDSTSAGDPVAGHG